MGILIIPTPQKKTNGRCRSFFFGGLLGQGMPCPYVGFLDIFFALFDADVIDVILDFLLVNLTANKENVV